MDFVPGQIIDVQVARINRFGLGVAEVDGVGLRIPHVLAGETVRARVGKGRKGIFEAEVAEVLAAAPGRRAAPCPVYGRCGGCDLQHMEYAAQLALKTAWVREACAGLAAGVIHPVAPSPREFGYRSRVTLHRSKAGIGYHRRGSHEIVPIKTCPLATPALNQKIAAAGLPISPEVPIPIHAPEPMREASLPPGGMPFELREDMGATFTQANALLNPELIRIVAHAARWRKSQNILELYAGSGNFSFALASICRNLTAVEGDAVAHAAAQARKKRLVDDGANASAHRIRFHRAEVRDFVFELIQAKERLDTIVCDPPREGLGDLATRLLELGAGRIVLISCELESFVRDAKALLGNGYRLDEITPLDMFPQTRHAEIVGKFLAGSFGFASG